MTTVGIIGVGYLGECLAEGLAQSGTILVLSPRNAGRVAELSARYGCEVAGSNAEVVEKSDLVLLATLPEQIAATAAGLPWRDGQRAISVAAGIELDAFAGAVAPALAVRAMPIASSRIRQSPTAFYPDDAMTAEILNRIGTAHPLENEAQFATASIFGAFYGLVYAFIDQASGWAEENGLPPETARQLSARMTQAAAAAIIDRSDCRPRELLDNLMTPGGITEAGLKVLERTQALERWSEALDASLNQSQSIGKGE